MKKLSLTLVLLLSYFMGFAQNQHWLGINLGYGYHGTGDMAGFTNEISLKKDTKKSLSYSISIANTIHWESFIFENPNLNPVNPINELKFNNTGIQLMGHLIYDFIPNPKIGLDLRIGPFLRYENTSRYSIFALNSVSTPQGEIRVLNLPIQDTNKSPWAVGLNPRINFSGQIGEKYLINANIGVQFDTNGNTITAIGLGVNRRISITN